MKFFIITISIFFSVSLMANIQDEIVEVSRSKKELLKIYGMASGLYSLGRDNNDIAMSLLNKRVIEENKNDFKNVSIKKLKKQVRECVFYTKGAYGDHLSKDQKYTFTMKFLIYLESLGDNVEFFEIETYKIGKYLDSVSCIPVSPECTLGIKYNNEVLLLTATLCD